MFMVGSEMCNKLEIAVREFNLCKIILKISIQ